MDEDDWNIEQPKAENKENEAGNTSVAKEEQEAPKKEEDENAEDSWIVQKSTEPQEGRKGGRRGQRIATVEQKVTVVEPPAEELKPDQHNQSAWDVQDKPKEQSKPTRGRGNRGEQQEGRGRGNRGEDEGRGRGNRGEEQGRGRGRGNRQGQEDDRNNRGTRNYDRNYRNNENGGQQRRGGYRGNDRGGDRGGDRGQRGGYRGGWNRDNGGGDRERGDRGDRGGDRGRGRGGYRGGFGNDNQQSQADQKALLELKAKNQEITPKARRCWPQCNIYVFGNRLCATFRKVQDFKCKLLVVPFNTNKLQYYPGNIVNQSKLNYKQKIAKKQQLKNGGETYFQKAVGVGNFEALAFLKIDQITIEQNLTAGIKQLFERIQMISEASFESVVFPVCTELSSQILLIIREVIKGLQQSQKVKNFYITTVDKNTFLSCISSFKEEIENLFEENELSIE